MACKAPSSVLSWGVLVEYVERLDVEAAAFDAYTVLEREGDVDMDILEEDELREDIL